jgi:hypothetical protein
MSRAAQAVVLSGGAEIVAASVAEALEFAGIRYAVIGLTPRSILRRARGAVSFFDLSGLSSDPNVLRDRLLDVLDELRAHSSRPLVTFATEDGGLRCLNEFAPDVLKFAEFPRARALRFGGLDKAELFAFLARSTAAAHIPATEILSDIAEVGDALDRLGGDAIFKPALKPWDMELRGMAGAKVVTRRDAHETRPELLRRLAGAWPLSRQWVAQARLQPYEEGERGVWSVHGHANEMAVQFVERWKYPAQGGTGCLVETRAGNDLMPAAHAILKALDYVGLSELPFLRDAQGKPKLLELNARAWLQEALAEKSGLPMVLASFQLLSGDTLSAAARDMQPTTWINVERALMAALTGEAGGRAAALSTLLQEMGKRPEYAIYSSAVSGVRSLWMGRLVRKGWEHLWKKPA